MRLETWDDPGLFSITLDLLISLLFMYNYRVHVSWLFEKRRINYFCNRFGIYLHTWDYSRLLIFES